jgi:hypothetical protein
MIISNGNFRPSRQRAKRREEETRRREAALGRERQRAEEIKDFAEARRVEEQQRVEIVARAEELRKALEEVRVARKAAADAEEQRLAALKAAEETQERLKTAGLPPSPLSQQIARDPEALARTRQAELARVGCDPGAVDGRWGAKAIEALRQFSRHAKVSLSVDEPTEDALRAIAAIKHPVCILKCVAHQKVSGGRCVPVAKSEPLAEDIGRPPGLRQSAVCDPFSRLSLCTVPTPRPTVSPPCRGRCPLPARVVHARSCRARPRPAKPPAHLASLGDELAVALELHLDDAQASPDPLPDHRALEFGEGVRQLEEQLAGRRGGVDRLLAR